MIVVLGIAQDSGVPQAGSRAHPGWTDPGERRHAACLGLVDPTSGERWMFDATPDFREQLHRLDEVAPPAADARAPALAGIFLTHAHMGHYTGLVQVGHESMAADRLSVYAMPRMRAFLSANGPWDQLVRYRNIALRDLADATPVELNERLTVTPLRVPHRQEYSEAVGFRIAGPRRAVLFVPDIDSWDDWDAAGTRVEEVLATVDVAYLDGSFYADGEIPGRDMSGFPHPFITASMARLQPLPAAERAKVRFIHLNHTNPALWRESDARRTVEERGFRIAEEGERVALAVG